MWGSATPLRSGPSKTRPAFPTDDSNTRAKTILSQDLGPIRSEIRFIVSDEDGGNWQALPIFRKGRLSNMSFNVNTGKITAEFETPRGDILRGAPRFWSHESQTRRDPNDEGFEFLSQMLSVRRAGSAEASSPAASIHTVRTGATVANLF